MPAALKSAVRQLDGDQVDLSSSSSSSLCIFNPFERIHLSESSPRCQQQQHRRSHLLGLERQPTSGESEESSELPHLAARYATSRSPSSTVPICYRTTRPAASFAIHTHSASRIHQHTSHPRGVFLCAGFTHPRTAEAARLKATDKAADPSLRPHGCAASVTPSPPTVSNLTSIHNPSTDRRNASQR